MQRIIAASVSSPVCFVSGLLGPYFDGITKYRTTASFFSAYLRDRHIFWFWSDPRNRRNCSRDMEYLTSGDGVHILNLSCYKTSKMRSCMFHLRYPFSFPQ